jgi:hypothetical protein
MKSSRIGFCKLKKYAQHIPKINAAQSKNKKKLATFYSRTMRRRKAQPFGGKIRAKARTRTK